jgi:hypothetical protein
MTENFKASPKNKAVKKVKGSIDYFREREDNDDRFSARQDSSRRSISSANSIPEKLGKA